MKTHTETARRMLLAISQPTNMDDLRALYVEAKSGVPTCYALICAALNAIADKDCAAKARKAFDALNLNFRDEASIEDLSDAAARGDYVAVVRLSSGSHRTDLWAAAMTAHYGPCDTHESWLNADGTPGAELLAKMPEIGRRMDAAKERVTQLIASYQREIIRRAEEIAWYAARAPKAA